MKRRTVLLVLAGVLVTAPAQACLWDTDTAAAEANGLPEVVEVITGRFEVNPPLYYEMRIARAEGFLKGNPDDLVAYDNAGVACDRLGRGDEAIAWMARKKAALDAMDPKAKEVLEHRYRYLANLGTFHAHRWVRGGAHRESPEQLEDLRRSKALIAEAIALNPNAHFGRERYQLLAIEAMLDGVGAGKDEVPTFLERRDWDDDRRIRFRSPQETGSNDGLAKLGYRDAVQGLAGLVVLGAAWESFDVFFALALALAHDGHSSLAFLAEHRLEEIVKQGKRSLLPGAPGDLSGRAYLQPYTSLEDGVGPELSAYYKAARSAADRFRAEREAFMLAKLRAGKHPDTDSTFWRGFEPAPPPPLPGTNVVTRTRSYVRENPGKSLMAILAGSTAGLLALWHRSQRAQERARAARGNAGPPPA